MKEHSINCLKIICILGMILFNIHDVNALVRIIDGDTLKIDNLNIRLQGVDAPELNQKCWDRKGVREWDCGKSSKAFVEGLIAGREVNCNVEQKRDKYKRCIGICYADGLEINKEIVRAGYGVAYIRYSKLYVADEIYAKSNKKGIWAGKFTAPEIYRRSKHALKKTAHPSIKPQTK